jgi:hypothetical protein
MDLGNPNFNFTEDRLSPLNSSATILDILFSGNDNSTVYIRIPKNSTILDTNINLLGQLKPVQSSTVEQIWDVVVGNVNYTNPWDEIVVGTSGQPYVKLLKNNGENVWNYSISGAIYAVAIGNLSDDSGNEVVAGGQGASLYLLNSSGQQKWNKSLMTVINDISVGKINSTKDYDQIAVATGSNARIFDYQGEEIWNYTGSTTFHTIAIGNLSSDQGNGIVAGDDSRVYELNSSGQQKWNLSLGTVVNSVATGNINDSQPYDEIVVAGNNGTVFALDNSGSVIWTFTILGAIANKVTIGDVTSQYSGNEIVVGGSNNKLYILNSSGNQIFMYTTENEVRGVGIGNLTQYSGDEIAAGTSIPAPYTLYILNLEYFPTNVTLDIGGDGDLEWNYPGKFRTTSSVSNITEFQDFLNSCTAVNDNCDVPLFFHSDFAGDLNITSVLVNYKYNISDIVDYTTVSAWSRTNNVRVNESVGNQIKNITYSRNPAVSIRVNYLKINSSATKCDFNGSSYTVTTVDNTTVCNISSLSHYISTGFDTLWDDMMTTATPIFINETAPVSEAGFWKKNITIWNTTQTIFTNVIANTTLDNSTVKSASKLEVEWYNNGTLYNVTPSSAQTDCNSAGPTYTSIQVGDTTFSVCKQDTDLDGVVDFFVWKQPNTNKSYTRYQASGSANNIPTLSDFNVTPSEGKWNNEFNISVNVTDKEGDNVTVGLCINLTHTFDLSQVNLSQVVWNCVDEKNTTGNTTTGQILQFNVTSNKTWSGKNIFRFEFRDFNSSSSSPYHDWNYSGIGYGPNVTKHNVSINYIQGNASQVNRTQSVLFIVQINDTDNNTEAVAGANCNFSVSLNDADWNWGYTTTSNNTGYCNYSFTPNGSYSPGPRWWRGGTYNDLYYYTNISTNYSVEIYGKLNINLTGAILTQNVTRQTPMSLLAKIYDEFNQTVGVSGYNCSWYVNGTFKETSSTNSTGYCNYSWSTNCSNNLGIHTINVTLSGNASNYYFINNTENFRNVTLKDNINVTIVLPTQGTIYHPGDILYLNSTSKDYCNFTLISPYNVTWNVHEINPDVTPPNFNLTGENSSIDIIYPPGFLNITIYAYGDLYNSTSKNISAWIYGWSQVNVSYPSNNQIYEKTELIRTLNISCFVYDKDQPLTWQLVDNYPVDIWNNSNKLTSGVISLGYFNYTWNISDLPDGNYTIKCNISDKNISSYTRYHAAKPNETVSVIIRERDTQPPTIYYISVNSTTPGNNVTIESAISDWYGVNKTWINLTYPNSTPEILYLTNTTSNIINTTWRLNITNLSQIGDYDIILYANDTPDANGTSRSSNSISWFEVYQPIQMYITTDSSINFTLYRPGTNWVVHNFTNSSGSCTTRCNLTLHKRNYDFVAITTDSIGQTHSIKFNDMNSTNTSLLQFGSIANITNPLNISGISLSLMPLSLSLNGNSIPIRTNLAALLVSQQISYSNVSITFNYSQLFNIYQQTNYHFYEPAIKVYRCENWANNSCSSGWSDLYSQVDLTNHLASATSNKSSLFFAAEPEICGNNLCGSGESCSNCPQDCGSCPSGITGGVVASGGGSGGISPVCGNSVCEAGESKENCPQDCNSPFTVTTNLTEVYHLPEQVKRYGLVITNNLKKNITLTISVTGPLQGLVKAENVATLGSLSNLTIPVDVFAPKETGTYTGTIIVEGAGKKEELPVSINVLEQKYMPSLKISIEVLSKKVGRGDVVSFKVSYDTSLKKTIDTKLTYSLVEEKTGDVVLQKSLLKTLEGSNIFIDNISVPKNVSLGRHFIKLVATYEDESVSAVDFFEVVAPFITSTRINQIVIITLTVLSIFLIWYGRKRFLVWKAAKARYIFPLNMGTLPKGNLWIGKIAETNTKATFDMNDLTTHVLIAGATGGGKSVTGNIFAEELLDKKIPVVVFDPTGQWTGFVRPCTDPKVLRYYSKYGLNKNDTKPYLGNIYEVNEPDVKIDFKKYMNPGEITVFVLNKLKSGDYDKAITNIVDTIFEQSWEESTELKLVIVFDEVHRLLEKYGGKGGYIALERACREFRKWGIGLIMISQVLSDFKEAVKGNVLTEVQMHTKGLEDLKRVETKYGIEYAKKVAREEIGIGMIQNPKYNTGIPWFIAFRPPLHMPHKIPEEEFKMYKSYNVQIEKIELEIKRLEKSGKDVSDFKIELKLAKDKLKAGRFRMAEIYINSLKKKLGIQT